MVGRIAALLRRQTPERPEVTAAVAQLTQLASAQPDLQHAAALQAALLHTLDAPQAPVAAPTLSQEEAVTRLSSSIPLLRQTPLPCTPRDLTTRFLRVCAVVEASATGSPPHASAPTAALRAAVASGQLNLWEYGNLLLTSAAPTVPAQLEAQGYPADLVMTLLRWTLLPVLEQVAVQLAPLRAAAPWLPGFCPTCGAWPLLAEQRGLEQFRYLRCGLCATSWASDRVRCPFCENRHHLLLGYLQVEGEEQKQRVATCDACRGYLKLRSTLTPLTTCQLLVEEVALVHLDLLALEHGYVPWHGG